MLRSTKHACRVGHVFVPLVAAVALLASACSVSWGGSGATPVSDGTGASTLQQTTSTSSGEDPVVAAIGEVTPAVVTITSRMTAQRSPFGITSSGQATGTGFVVRSDGIIMTNQHVVEGAQTVTATLPEPGGRTLDATVVATDEQHDLAVLRVDATGLPTVALGDSKDLQLGQQVIALGYALGLQGGPTVTSGIVSSLDRTIHVQDPNTASGSRTYADVLQTDAAINPGNSGGPLIDLAGAVVGIDSAGSSSAENIGFAIAIDAAKPLIQQALGSTG
ncbi:MAG: trypsin-like peptidase domain-containing protein [Actinobacteria bacterium]|nr:trypsin-like peptidase domain-containing protein [Actinomycetota bacterium]